MRKSSLYLILVILAVASLCALLAIHPRLTADTFQSRVAEEKRLVRDLALTDLCLFTEARYTRHLSQADLHSPFQDHPVSLEHFPSGSLVLPPEWLRAGRNVESGAGQ